MEKAVLLRIRENRKEILLFILSLIQGLAFSKLLENIFSELDGGIVDTDTFVLIAHSVLCFFIIIRLFETLLLGFLDYDEAVSTMYEAILVFVIGAFEYWLIDALIDFNGFDFYLRLMILAVISSAGYIVTVVKITGKKYRKKLFYDKSSFLQELLLQSVNITVLIIIVTISLLVISNRISTKSEMLISAIILSLIVVINIVSSWYFTITMPRKNKPWPNDDSSKGQCITPLKVAVKDGSNEYSIRAAMKKDINSIAMLYTELFPYVFQGIFDTSDRIINRILSRLIGLYKGATYWGYGNTVVITKDSTDEVVGFIVFKPQRSLSFFQYFGLAVYVIIIVIANTGLIGLARFLRNSYKNRNAAVNPPKDELYISYIGIIRDYQYTGAARMLMEYAENIARAGQFKSIGLDVRENNKTALKFFKKAGFRIAYTMEDNAFSGYKRIYMRQNLS